MYIFSLICLKFVMFTIDAWYVVKNPIDRDRKQYSSFFKHAYDALGFVFIPEKNDIFLLQNLYLWKKNNSAGISRWTIYHLLIKVNWFA